MRNKKLIQFPAAPGIECPQCDSTDVKQRQEHETFRYGSADEAVELEATVTVLRCQNCGLEYTDDSAEDSRHEAVCRHLGVLTPREMRALRSKLGLSRMDFSQLTGIGSASLARWENGNLIQNAAADNLLFLLEWDENVARLQGRAFGPNQTPPGLTNAVSDISQFRHLPEPEHSLREADYFQLHPACGV